MELTGAELLPGVCESVARIGMRLASGAHVEIGGATVTIGPIR